MKDWTMQLSRARCTSLLPETNGLASNLFGSCSIRHFLIFSGLAQSRPDVVIALCPLIEGPVDGDCVLAVEVHEPVISATEQCAANDVAQARGDDAFPYIQPDRDLRCVLPDAHGNEEHVGDNVIEAERHEGEDRPPDADDLGDQFTSLHPEEAGQTDEPITADASQEYHVPFGCDLLFRCEGDSLGFVRVGVEDSTVCSAARSVQ